MNIANNIGLPPSLASLLEEEKLTDGLLCLLPYAQLTAFEPGTFMPR